MIERTVEITNKTGLHARPASQFVELANKFQSKITIQKDSKTVDAKSILGILSLGLAKGTTVKITAGGEDEMQAMEGLVRLLASFHDADT